MNNHDEELTMAGNIKLAGAQWTWVGATFAESAGIYRALGVDAMDLIAMPGGLLTAEGINADAQGEAGKVKGLDIELVNLIVLLGEGFADRALNSPDEAVRQQNRDRIRRLSDFCAAAGLKSLTLLPGVEHEGMSREDAQAIAAAELHAAAEITAAVGIAMVFEPHRESVLESPRETLRFMEQNPDLRICVDYAHCISLGHQEDELHPLLPYAGHVHLRQGASGMIQQRWDQGEIDFPGLMGRLRETGYEGYATLEYEHEEFWDMDKCDVMTETIKMRDAVRPFTS